MPAKLLPRPGSPFKIDGTIKNPPAIGRVGRWVARFSFRNLAQRTRPRGAAQTAAAQTLYGRGQLGHTILGQSQVALHRRPTFCRLKLTRPGVKPPDRFSRSENYTPQRFTCTPSSANIAAFAASALSALSSVPAYATFTWFAWCRAMNWSRVIPCSSVCMIGH